MSTQSYDGQTAAAVALAALAAAINVALAFGIIMLQSWIADGIKGDELFPWWPSGAFKPDEPRIVECILYMLLLSGLFAALLYIRRRSFLPVDVQRIGAPGRVVPRAVLVLGISRVKWKWTPGELTRGSDDSREVRPLPASLSEALTAMAALGKGEEFSWEQLLRALQEHAPLLQRVVLVGSRGDEGTAALFEPCREMIAYYFPQLEEDAFEVREACFEELNDLLCVYREIVATQAHRKGQVMIDVTGGTKVVSIAAAMVTLEHSKVEFQYVETEGEKRVRTFNVISGNGGGGDGK